MTLHVKLVIISVFSLCSLIPCETAHSRFDLSCNYEVDPPSNIVELIESSKFIGLYTAVEAQRTDNTERHEFRLTLSTSVAGATPSTLTISGILPVEGVLSSYFYISERHAALVETDSLTHGLAFRDIDDDGQCIYVPTFVLGYNYLIFSGFNSNASFEPVLSTTYDPFYLEVLRHLRSN